ncbi:16S rRNA (uracil(1498)-N(3))-methyltransferase [Cytophagaceae bacterium YF14B1]|uniref:Ribosomal RNA small subunit methyltransferase E n=1 Tax=Xanthocytophaga flava TaxID=3048013 RepID=A0AAE3QPU2_9BACT|nr:16S rRNA (uracil(1498)-N(3))-methyltransferase [Xanthocytophaga flavus]MDJ1480518.1 16S rRNA (uracil(1498)-N(3))-methyltransferase [Xanthocytophaga flavus]
MLLFYAPDFTTDSPLLPEEETRHALKVLRLETGELIHITDGKGNLYTTKIVSSDLKKPRFQIMQHQSDYGKRDYFIHVAVAPTKNPDRTEWLVEKCVELGIDTISFIQCDHSERKHFKTDRLEKICISAMKQSLKAQLPEIQDIIPFEKFVTKTDLWDQKFIGYLDEQKKYYLSEIAKPNQRYCILIGPEGDFSPREVGMAQQQGFIPVSLGESRLRTETAAMAACHILNIINQK